MLMILTKCVWDCGTPYALILWVSLCFNKKQTSHAWPNLSSNSRQDGKPADGGASSLVSTIASKDFPMASFHVAMGRIQQLALSKANCKVPCPEDQLARFRSKQGKAERLKLGFALTVHYHMGPLLGYLHYHFFIQRK